MPDSGNITGKSLKALGSLSEVKEQQFHLLRVARAARPRLSTDDGSKCSFRLRKSQVLFEVLFQVRLETSMMLAGGKTVLGFMLNSFLFRLELKNKLRLASTSMRSEPSFGAGLCCACMAAMFSASNFDVFWIPYSTGVVTVFPQS